jgi:hypothetical protein
MKKIFLVLLFFYFCINSIAYAQVNVTNKGILKVSIGTDTVYVNGDYSNNSTAALTNNGNFYIKQNLSNDEAAMAVGTGTLYLNGSIAQAVNGSQIFKTYNLISNNSSTGITINNNLSVSGSHSFTNGMIITSATPNYLVYQAGSSYSGDNDSRHVNGWVKKYGTTNFVFPVGDATYERTAGVTNLSASSEINCKYYTPTNNIFNLFSPLVAVDPNEYWQIDKISGGTAQIALNWDNAKVAFPNVLLTDISVAHYTGPNWIDAGGVGTASGNPLTTGNITSNAVNIFGPFTFGFTSTPLPLRLISFNAERRSGTSFLNWVTQNEENVDHFEIQRSATPTNFISIGTVGARNITSRQEYYFEDHSPLNGIAYYRLRSVDRDGKTSYSKITAVNERQLQSAGFIILNPARNGITIFNKTGKEGSFDYKLMNAAGQLLLKGAVSIGLNGNVVLSVPSQIPTAIYLLELSNQTIQFRQKILIEK